MYCTHNFIMIDITALSTAHFARKRCMPSLFLYTLGNNIFCTVCMCIVGEHLWWLISMSIIIQTTEYIYIAFIYPLIRVLHV